MDTFKYCTASRQICGREVIDMVVGLLPPSLCAATAATAAARSGASARRAAAVAGRALHSGQHIV